MAQSLKHWAAPQLMADQSPREAEEFSACPASDWAEGWDWPDWLWP